MPQRKFANQRPLSTTPSRTALWQDAKRRPSVPAFTRRQQMLSPDQYEIVGVRTRYGLRRAMLFPKAILQAEFEANRERLAMKRERWRAKRAATPQAVQRVTCTSLPRIC
jgi:hypothetical protein